MHTEIIYTQKTTIFILLCLLAPSTACSRTGYTSTTWAPSNVTVTCDWSLFLKPYGLIRGLGKISLMTHLGTSTVMWRPARGHMHFARMPQYTQNQSSRRDLIRSNSSGEIHGPRIARTTQRSSHFMKLYSNVKPITASEYTTFGSLKELHDQLRTGMLSTHQ